MDLRQLKKIILNDPFLSKLLRLVKEKGAPLFIVGGYLRNHLLGITSKDYDFVLPKEASFLIPFIEELLHQHFFRVGKEEMNTLTYRVIREGISIDLTLLQGGSIKEDLQRRDFTINAIAFSLLDETFYWTEKGLEDIDHKLIRTVSNHSIDQDPLRMLRAVRYLCTLNGFSMDKALEQEILIKKEKIWNIPSERIKPELDTILLSPKPSIGLKFLYQVNMFFTLFPEFKGLENLGQNEHHHLDVLSHTFLVIEKLSWAYEWIVQNDQEFSLNQENRIILSYAALFHDLGKQNTYGKDERGRVHFYHHESFSSILAERIMEKLRFSHMLRNKILHLVKNHMKILNLSRETKESALKRLIHQIGEETSLLILLTLADKEASRGVLSLQIDEVVEQNCLRILKLLHEKESIHPSPFITGHDVMALGYPQGPRIGQILNFIRQKQVEGKIKNREEALRVLKNNFGG